MKYEAITKQITKVNLIVSLGDFKDKEKDKLAELVAYLNLNAVMYGAILHDKDVKENGESKIPHLHAVYTIPKRKRISTIINEVADSLGCKCLAVTVESFTSFEGSFQYLTHKNDKDKYQYPRSDVKSNLSGDELNLVYESDTSVLDFERLRSICEKASSLLDVISIIGLGAYQHYRASVIDVWRIVHLTDPFEVFNNGQGKFSRRSDKNG